MDFEGYRQEESGRGPWHSVTSDVYHNNPSCQTGSTIEPANIRQGTGGNRLCEECERLNSAARPVGDLSGDLQRDRIEEELQWEAERNRQTATYSEPTRVRRAGELRAEERSPDGLLHLASRPAAKPIGRRDAFERIRARVRRNDRAQESLSIGDVSIDVAGHAVTRGGEPLAKLKDRVTTALFERMGGRLNDASLSEEKLHALVRFELNRVVEDERVPLSAEQRLRLISNVEDDVLGHGPLQRLLDDALSSSPVRGGDLDASANTAA